MQTDRKLRGIRAGLQKTSNAIPNISKETRQLYKIAQMEISRSSRRVVGIARLILSPRAVATIYRVSDTVGEHFCFVVHLRRIRQAAFSRIPRAYHRAANLNF